MKHTLYRKLPSAMDQLRLTHITVSESMWRKEDADSVSMFKYLKSTTSCLKKYSKVIPSAKIFLHTQLKCYLFFL